METAVYLSATVLTILWSVWTFSAWTGRVKMSEESISRFFLVLSPSMYFLLAVAAGLRAGGFRFDIFGLIFIDAVTIICIIFLLIFFQFARKRKKNRFKLLLWIYNAFCILGIAGLYIIRSSPVLIMRIANFAAQVSKINIFSFEWFALDPISKSQDVAGMLNKLVIALITYLPVSILRFIYTNRKRAQLKRELDRAVKRIDSLEKRIRQFDNSNQNNQK